MFFSKIKNKILPKKQIGKEELKTVTENLYKKNVELAIKNKTLSLLSDLYDISILNIPPKELSEKFTDIIQKTLDFEIVEIFLFKNQTELVPLSTDLSERADKAQAKYGLDKIRLSYHSEQNILEPVIKQKKHAYTEKISDIWGSYISSKTLDSIQEQAHIKSALLYPLISEDDVVGVLLLALNRPYNVLAKYEKESINSIVNISAIALDKALVYEKLKVTNKKLEQANEHLQELDKLKSEFLSFASHQLRNPLTAMKGYASMLMQGEYGEVKEEQKKPVETIYNATDSLVKMVQDFLDVSKIEQGGMKYHKEPVDLRKMVEQVVSELQPAANDHGLVINKHIEEGDFVVNADEVKLKQVVVNIIDNAIKYTPEGSIDVSLTPRNDWVRLEVKDSGVGIDEEDIDKLFTKFTRAKDAHRQNSHGSGLGMYLAKMITEAHHGHIWAESEGSGKGTSFIVELKKAK